MPAQKRSSSHHGGEMQSVHPPHRPRRKQSKRSGGDQSATAVAVQEEEVEVEVEVEVEEEEEEEHQQLPNDEHQEEQANQEDDQSPAQQLPDEDSDGSGTDPEEFDEVIDVIRSAVRNNVQCPICLGIIKKTRTVMGCLHRFCRECIDKSMRLGNNECPACRIHCSSRRSLRDDLDFDALIHALYPDMVTYEEQELVLHEEEKTRNEQIQASIAQISRRQSEALNKRRRIDRDTEDIRVPRYTRNTSSRRRNHQRTDMEAGNANERENELDGNLDQSASDLSQTQVRNRRPGRSGTQPPPISPAANLDGENSESPTDPLREEVLNPLGAMPEMLTWGGGGARSHTRHGSGNGARSASKTRLAKLMESLENDAKVDYMAEIHFTVIALDKERIPNLETPYLCIQSSFTISQLCQFIAEQTKSQAEDIEMLLVREEKGGKPALDLSHIIDSEPHCNEATWSSIRLEVLEGPETLAGIRSTCFTRVLMIAYQHKKERRFEVSPV